MEKQSKEKVSYGELIGALEHVCYYLEREEHDDYYQTDEEDRGGHVYEAVLVLNRWVQQEEARRFTLNPETIRRSIGFEIDQRLEGYQRDRVVMLAIVLLVALFFFLPELLRFFRVVGCASNGALGG